MASTTPLHPLAILLVTNPPGRLSFIQLVVGYPVETVFVSENEGILIAPHAIVESPGIMDDGGYPKLHMTSRRRTVKTLITVMLAVGLVAGSVTVTFAQDTSNTGKKSGKKGKKKGGEEQKKQVGN